MIMNKNDGIKEKSTDMSVSKIYAVYKKKPFTTGVWFQADDREFKNCKECVEEAKKLGGIALIKRVKTENGWEQIEI